MNEVRAKREWPPQQTTPLITARPSGGHYLATLPMEVDLSAWKKHDVRGVYLLTNAVSGKVYVGSSDRVIARLRTHITALRKGKHYNKKLSNAWAKYGEASWTWSVLEAVPGENLAQLLEREQHWIDSLNSFKHGYNMAEFAGASMKGRKHSPETRAKCALAAAKLDRSSPEYRKKLSQASSGPRNARYGALVSQETRARIARSQTGKKHTQDTKDLMSLKAKEVQVGEKNGFYGRRHTEETRARLVQNLHNSRHKSIEAVKKRKGKSWEELYGSDTAARMRSAIVESNKRRANGKDS